MRVDGWCPALGRYIGYGWGKTCWNLLFQPFRGISAGRGKTLTEAKQAISIVKKASPGRRFTLWRLESDPDFSLPILFPRVSRNIPFWLEMNSQKILSQQTEFALRQKLVSSWWAHWAMFTTSGAYIEVAAIQCFAEQENARPLMQNSKNKSSTEVGRVPSESLSPNVRAPGPWAVAPEPQRPTGKKCFSRGFWGASSFYIIK